MAKLRHREAARYVACCWEFAASNLSGRWKDGVYVVTSYGWYPVFVCVDGTWYGTTDKYSKSTACQMSKVQPSGVTWVSQDALRSLARGRREAVNA